MNVPGSGNTSAPHDPRGANAPLYVPTLNHTPLLSAQPKYHRSQTLLVETRMGIAYSFGALGCISNSQAIGDAVVAALS